jgi:hypothetical protein
MAIKNGQTREPQATLGIRQIAKTKKTKSITQKAKKMSNTDPVSRCTFESPEDDSCLFSNDVSGIDDADWRINSVR